MYYNKLTGLPYGKYRKTPKVIFDEKFKKTNVFKTTSDGSVIHKIKTRKTTFKNNSVKYSKLVSSSSESMFCDAVPFKYSPVFVTTNTPGVREKHSEIRDDVEFSIGDDMRVAIDEFKLNIAHRIPLNKRKCMFPEKVKDDFLFNNKPLTTLSREQNASSSRFSGYTSDDSDVLSEYGNESPRDRETNFDRLFDNASVDHPSDRSSTIDGYPSVKLCFYHKRGNCINGEACRFFHESSSPVRFEEDNVEPHCMAYEAYREQVCEDYLDMHCFDEDCEKLHVLHD